MAIPATLVLHGPTTLKVMHCADLDSAKAAVTLVRECGGRGGVGGAERLQ